MPTARETLLEAAHEAVIVRPWAGVRMVEIAERAGVSRQTLYNEFGSKEGLGSALISRRVTGFVDSVAAVAARSARKDGDVAFGCAAAAVWMLRTAPSEPLVRSALTGCWDSRMPPAVTQRPDTPGELAARLRDRVVTALTVSDGDADHAGGGANPAYERSGGDGAPDGQGVGGTQLRRACEAGMRLALSYLVAPDPTPGAGVDPAPAPALDPSSRTDPHTDPEEAAGQRIAQMVRALLH
ncbi:TetR/AcrR family transcriptional regulator [Streptomyces oceani]|uniref:TetR/AcrR family transcriptional regulator n=1 Tax=Streptomyces oceani TaxID=1075402 RepID=UPI00087293F4|nr:helix-turn-helix domain-containing protein [Streptomyces oceani]